MGKYHDRINWKKELRLLPGYIIVCAWVALTAAILFWIVCASLSSTKEILTGRVMDFSNGLKWDNYVTAWNTQNVSLYFFNSLVYVYYRFRGLSIVQGVLAGLRPAVIAMIASAGISLLILALYGQRTLPADLSSFDLMALVIFLAGFFVLRKWKPSPIKVMAGAAVAGVVLYSITA